MKRIFTVDIHDEYRSYQIIDKMTFILLTYLKYFYFNEWVSLPLEFEKVYKCRAQLKTEKPPFQEKTNGLFIVLVQVYIYWKASEIWSCELYEFYGVNLWFYLYPLVVVARGH